MSDKRKLQTEEELRAKVFKIFYKGGPYSQNMISITLSEYAKNVDKGIADKVYGELLREGF